MKPSVLAERAVRNVIEARGFTVHDANVLFGSNCPNIDLVAFGWKTSKYIQVKLSSRPSRKDAIVIDGAPWTEDQLFGKSTVFNRHPEGFFAQLVVIAHEETPGNYTYYVAPPDRLQKLLLPRARSYANKPKRDGGQRKMFRKELPIIALKRYRNAWRYLGKSIS